MSSSNASAISKAILLSSGCPLAANWRARLRARCLILYSSLALTPARTPLLSAVGSNPSSFVLRLTKLLKMAREPSVNPRSCFVSWISLSKSLRHVLIKLGVSLSTPSLSMKRVVSTVIGICIQRRLSSSRKFSYKESTVLNIASALSRSMWSPRTVFIASIVLLVAAATLDSKAPSNNEVWITAASCKASWDPSA